MPEITDIKAILAERIQERSEKVGEWFAAQAEKAPPPFYTSVDLRDAGYKIAPVDNNLYPAGFNNLCSDDLATAPEIARKVIEGFHFKCGLQTVEKILIIPESNTKNRFYIENLYYLSQLIRDAGYEVAIGWYDESGQTHNPIDLESASGKNLVAYPIQNQNGSIEIEGFRPEIILLNNDFSGGFPQLLDEAKQPILPSHRLGWHTRRKSEHFRFYNELASDFAQLIDVDPWWIQVETESVNDVNFNEAVGIEATAEVASSMLTRIEKRYKELGVSDPPTVFVKNNSGTYGMGIMAVQSGEQLLKMNRRSKNKMSVGKNRSGIGSVIVQEGIPTHFLVSKLPAEPVIYLMQGELIGGFLRTNSEKSSTENLNAQGMVFKKLCISDLRTPDRDSNLPTLELVYGTLAQISALATGRELAPNPCS